MVVLFIDAHLGSSLFMTHKKLHNTQKTIISSLFLKDVIENLSMFKKNFSNAQKIGLKLHLPEKEIKLFGTF